MNRFDRSIWIEEEYLFYGDLTKVLVPEKALSFDNVYELFAKSKDISNIIGSINYMIENYNDLFLEKINSGEMDNSNGSTDILHHYFSIFEPYGDL